VNNRGVVLDVVGSRGAMFGNIYSVGAGEEKAVCARPRVRSVVSTRSSRRSSVRSSMEVLRREEVLGGGSVVNGGDGMQLAESSISDRIRSQRWVLKRPQPTSSVQQFPILISSSLAMS